METKKIDNKQLDTIIGGIQSRGHIIPGLPEGSPAAYHSLHNQLNIISKTGHAAEARQIRSMLQRGESTRKIQGMINDVSGGR